MQQTVFLFDRVMHSSIDSVSDDLIKPTDTLKQELCDRTGLVTPTCFHCSYLENLLGPSPSSSSKSILRNNHRKHSYYLSSTES